MSKWFKRLLSLAVIGSIIAGVVYYFQKEDSMESDDYMDDFEDEDFDLDDDLKPVADREYVPLNTPEQAKEAVSAVKETVEDIAETVTENASDAVGALKDAAEETVEEIKDDIKADK